MPKFEAAAVDKKGMQCYHCFIPTTEAAGPAGAKGPTTIITLNLRSKVQEQLAQGD